MSQSGYAGGAPLPGFTILETLSRRPGATVYRAHQESLRRDVTIEVLDDGVDDPAAWAAFRREARATTLARHSAIVTVYTAGRTADGTFAADTVGPSADELKSR
jgi:hypothetical protein